MTNIYVQLTEQFVNTQFCANAARFLNTIVHEVIEDQRLDKLHDITKVICDAAFVKLNEFCSQNDHSPYYIATGMEANLMFIASEVNESIDDDSRWTLAKLAYLAKKLEEADDIPPLSDLDHISSILGYCFHTFRCMDDKAEVIVIAIPDIDIDCVAAHTHNNTLPITIVNAKHFIAQLLDTFSYEAAALLIAGGKDIPKEAIKLMQQTTVPEINNLPKEKHYEYYLKSIKIGLAHDAPHGRSIENGYDDKSYSGVWHEYLLNLHNDQ